MKKITIGLFALALVAGVGILSINMASAHQENNNLRGNNFRNNTNSRYYSPERHEAMEKAFADKDYNAWAKLMANRGRMSEFINQDNFPKLAEAHNLAEQGQTEAAQKIRQELGLNLHQGRHFDGSCGHMMDFDNDDK